MRWMWSALTFAILVAFAASIQARAQNADTEALRKRAAELFAAGHYSEALTVSEEWADAAEKAETSTGKPGYATANALGTLAWYALFAKEPDKALEASERAIRLSPYQVAARTNRAHALLFLGRNEDAIAAYIEHKGEAAGERKWENVILEDFAEFRSRGLNHPDLARAEKAIAEAPESAQAKAANDAEALKQQALELNKTKNPEAITVAQRALALAERVLGKDHPKTLDVVRTLGWIYGNQNHVDNMVQLHKRVLDTYERVLGKDAPDTIVSVSVLALSYEQQHRFDEAEALYKRSLEWRKRMGGYESLGTLYDLERLGVLYYKQGLYEKAEPLQKRALEITEHLLGKEHPDALENAIDLAGTYHELGRVGDAIRLYEHVLEVRERLLGNEDLKMLEILNYLGEEYSGLRSRRKEAESLLKRALDGFERTLGKDAPATLEAADNLAFVYKATERYREAEQLYNRVLEARERLLGQEDFKTLNVIYSLADLYFMEQRWSDAEPLLKRALEGRERLVGTQEWDHGIEQILNELGAVYFAQGDWMKAAQSWRRTNDIVIRLVKQSNSKVGSAPTADTHLISDASSHLVQAMNRLAPEGSEMRAKASREMFEIAQWALFSGAADSLSQMAARAAKDDPALSALARERQDLVAEWQNRDASRDAAFAKPVEKRDAKAEGENLTRLTAIDERIAEIDRRMAAAFPEYDRLTSPVPLAAEEVQSLLRPNEAFIFFLDINREYTRAGETFIWVLTKTDMRWVRTDLDRKALHREVTALRCGLDATSWDDEGAVECAKFLHLPPNLGPKNGKPLPFDAAWSRGLYNSLFGQVEDLIKGKNLLIVPSGALTQLPFQVLVQSLPKGVVAGRIPAREISSLGITIEDVSRKDRERLQWDGEGGVRIVKVDDGKAAAAAGLKVDDVLLAIGDAKAESTDKTIDAIRSNKPGATVQVGLLRAGQKLEIIATLGARTVQEWRPYYVDATNARGIYWLVRDHAITVLPAVSSLKALRRVAKPSGAVKPMIGFGNPLLDGDQGDPRYGDYYKQRAALARDNQRCRGTMRERVAAPFAPVRGVTPVATRGGLADLDHLKAQAPLPETADELCAVARDLGADAGEMRLGARATEGEVKALSASGALAQYRIVHFATHGALAGQLNGTSEPGLILTPPAAATEEDDGYLSASEIAGLKLDADWVILSACNTAAGGATGAEALSGLARAFFYAQARALLVSHWAVNSNATVKLITSAVSTLRRHPRIGRAEALRRAMLAMIDRGKPYEGHPSYWAPSVLVGEGGAGR